MGRIRGLCAGRAGRAGERLCLHEAATGQARPHRPRSGRDPRQRGRAEACRQTRGAPGSPVGEGGADMALRLVFMGTPDFAVPTLVEIVGRGHEVVAVYTRAPKPAGRAAWSSRRARSSARRGVSGLPVLTPATLRTADAESVVRAHGADAAVVVAYGLILPKPILDAFPLGAFNLHASLLPRWRGAAPINRAIMAGDAETGVTVMKMEEGLDTGPIGDGRARADRARHDRGRPARPARAPRRRPDGARARRARARLAHAHAAAAGGRHLCGQDRQGRDPHRLDAALAGGARPHPRPLAVSRRLVRDREARRAARVKVLRTTRARAPARPARCSTTGSPSPAARARCAFWNCSAPAARR